MSTDLQTQPDNWTRLARTIGKLLGLLLRLIFVLLLAAGLGAGVYFGIPWVYQTVIGPVQDTAVQVKIIENRVENLRDTLADSQAAQDERLTELETSGDVLREQVAAAELAAAQTGDAVSEESAARSELEAAVAELRGQNEDLTSANESLAANVAALEAELETVRDDFSAVQAEADALAALFELQQTLGGVRNALFQARLELLYENTGTARQILTGATADLITLTRSQSQLPSDERTALSRRIQAAGELIEDDPLTALSELESAWSAVDQLLFANVAER